MIAVQVLSICAIAAITAANPLLISTKEGCSTEGTDINAVIKYLRNEAFMNGLDPFPISEVPEQTFKFHYLLTDHKGTLHLTQGLATDLSTLHLSDSSNGQIACDGNNIVASLILDFDDIITSWKYVLNAGVWNPEGYCTVKTVGTQVALDIALGLDTGLLSLQKLEIVSPGTSKITFTNMGNIQDAVTEPIQKVYADNISPLLGKQIFEKVTEIINNTPPLFTPAPTTSTTVEPTTSTTTVEPTTSTTTEEPTTSTTTVEPTTSTTTEEPTTSTTTVEPTTATEEPTTSTTTVEPTTATVEPTTVTVEPTTATVEPTTATVEPTTATVEPTTATVEPTTATVEPTTATVEPTTATIELTTSPSTPS